MHGLCGSISTHYAVGVYGPMNEELTRVGGDAPADVLALAKEAYEAPWNVWNGVRTNCSSGLTRAHSSLLLAPVTANGRTRPG